jgi:hypothetical protein
LRRRSDVANVNGARAAAVSATDVVAGDDVVAVETTEAAT